MQKVRQEKREAERKMHEANERIESEKREAEHKKSEAIEKHIIV